jgi:hydroxyacylglutathione hydrolase
LVFTGDTIFIGGCGRFFEGDGRDMQRIITRAKKFHPDTRIFCGHDYTLANLTWAIGIEWENPAYESYKVQIGKR